MIPQTVRKFQLWRDCETNGWDRTQKEVAASLDWDLRVVQYVIARAGWTGRVGDFSGYGKRISTRNRKRLHAGGANVDTNMLDVTDLMKFGDRR